MAKKNNEAAPEQLTPEQMAAKLQELEAANAELEAKNKKLSKQAKAASKDAEAVKPEDCTFEVEQTDEEGNETGNTLKYRFTLPQIEIDKVVYKAAELVAETKNAKLAKKNAEILSHLVDIGSGAIELVPEEGGE